MEQLQCHGWAYQPLHFLLWWGEHLFSVFIFGLIIFCLYVEPLSPWGLHYESMGPGSEENLTNWNNTEKSVFLSNTEALLSG